MRPLDDLDEQLKNEENTKLNYITPAITSKWNSEGDRIVMEYGKEVDTILQTVRFLWMAMEIQQEVKEKK